MKLLFTVLVLLLAVLQYALWVGRGSAPELWRMDQMVAAQKNENADLTARNKILQAEVNDLKQGQLAIEQRARSELGMVKQGEVFYQFVEKPSAS